jgi:outer membrane protein TolC
MGTEKSTVWCWRALGLLAVALLAAACASLRPAELREPVHTVTPDSGAASTTAPSDPPGELTLPPSPPIPPEGPLQLTIAEAIVLTFANNRSLRVEKLNPDIQRTFEDEERAVFDPTGTGTVLYGYDRERRRVNATAPVPDIVTRDTALELGVAQFFPTGTDVRADLTFNRAGGDRIFSDDYGTRAGLSVTQALLRGAGVDVNLATLRQARKDTLISGYELRGFSESLLAAVESTYWQFALAQRQIQIVEDSLKLADQQLSETRDMIQVGKLAESEIAAAEAEKAQRLQNLIDAKSLLEQTRLRLLRFLNPPGELIWNREITLRHPPELPEIKLDPVESHVALALRMRPEINQARLIDQRDELEIVKTRNGLLPKMDLFVTLGKSGYADSFGGSVSDITGDSYDALVGINLEYPFGNREADARHRRARLTRAQSQEAIDNLTQLIELDVRSAFI